jgi:DNA-binding SARP family transcriptional activator
MPVLGSVSERFIHRLAEGVPRARLVDSIVASRPPLVLIAAPSGYGKTVLAAQVASSRDFGQVAWIGVAGEDRSIREVLGRLACFLAEDTAVEDLSVPELCHLCSEELTALPDNAPLLVVVDDAPWGGDEASLQLLQRMFSEAPAGSSIVITTRAEAPTDPWASDVWVIATEQLMLTGSEIAQVWHRHARRSLDHTLSAEVAAASRGHAALVTLMARHSALVDRDVTRVERTASISSLLNSLVVDQLDVKDRELLDCAAVLGSSTMVTLRECSIVDDAAQGMRRIAAALPLVSLSGSGACQRFLIHDLVSEVRGSAEGLYRRDPAGFRRAIDHLASSGSSAQALNMALSAGATELVTELLMRHGAHLVKGASWEAVRAAIDSLPPALVASEPTLLLVRAEAAWLECAKLDAVRQATLAIRLGELSGDGSVPPNARSLLAGMRMSLADFAGAASDIAPFLETDALTSADDLADLLYAAIPAYGFLADRDGLARCCDAALRLISAGDAAGSRLARLEMAMGIVADLVEGDSPRATLLLSAAASREDIPESWRAMALCNVASSALEAGELERSRSRHAEASLIGSAFSTPVDRGLLALVHATLESLLGSGSTIRSEVEQLVAACVRESEVFTRATTCIIGTVTSVSLRDREYAHGLGERALQAASATGSPILVWFAELVHAQASLALGDVERARRTAERILPQVESVGAMGHVLHARLILAQAALSDGDLAAAVQHITAVADHIVEKSPAMVVASYARAFPEMLGPLALAMGVDQVPVRVLNLIQGEYATEALAKAAAVLTPAEVKRLSRRMTAEAKRAAEQQKPEPVDAVCHVRLFGGLEVIAPRGRVGDRDWTKRKARLLFAMLVSRYGTDVPRGEIIEYLWPEMEEERALNNFYVVWSAMKRALSPESVRESPCPFVEHTHGVCRVVSGAVISDLDRFAEFQSQARAAREVGDSDRELAALRGMADLYRGELLPGDVYDDWFAPLRERLRREYEDAMLRAAQIFEGRHEEHEGLGMLRGAMENDPWREDLYQATLRLQIASGQRSTAIATYFACRTRLVEDLGIDPSRETTALYEQVLGMEERPHGGENG